MDVKNTVSRLLILPLHWIQMQKKNKKPDPYTHLKDVLRGFWDVFRGGKCITKPQVLLWRFKFLFTHKGARRGTFSSIGWSTSLFYFSLSLSLFPAAWEGLIRHISIYGGETSESWGGIQIVWCSDWLTFYYYYYLIFFNSVVLLWGIGFWTSAGGAKPLCMMVGIKLFL